MKKILLALTLIPYPICATQQAVPRSAQQSPLEKLKAHYAELSRDPIAHEKEIRALLGDAIKAVDPKISFWAKREIREFEDKLTEARKKKGMEQKSKSATEQEKKKKRLSADEQKKLDDAVANFLDRYRRDDSLEPLKKLFDNGATVPRLLFLVGVNLYAQDLIELGLRYHGQPSMKALSMALQDRKFDLASIMLDQMSQVDAGTFIHPLDPIPLSLAQKLLSKGADPKVTFRTSSLTSNLANPPVVEFLIMNGADVNFRSGYSSGFSDLITAIISRSAPDETIKLLLQHGADPLLEDNEGHNAYWHASRPYYLVAFDPVRVEAKRKLLRDYALEKGGKHLENNPLFQQ